MMVVAFWPVVYVCVCAKAPYILVVCVCDWNQMVVYEMLRWHSPPVLILLALLVSWNTQIPHTQEPKLTLTKLIHMLSNEENHKKKE